VNLQCFISQQKYILWVWGEYSNFASQNPNGNTELRLEKLISAPKFDWYFIESLSLASILWENTYGYLLFPLGLYLLSLFIYLRSCLTLLFFQADLFPSRLSIQPSMQLLDDFSTSNFSSGDIPKISPSSINYPPIPDDNCLGYASRLWITILHYLVYPWHRIIKGLFSFL